jgi:hypothetical protein
LMSGMRVEPRARIVDPVEFWKETKLVKNFLATLYIVIILVYAATVSGHPLLG